VYSVHDEHLVAKALEADFTYHTPLVTFIPVASSAVKTNENDNDLSEVYLVLDGLIKILRVLAQAIDSFF
jgi:hypothetical protein